MKPLVEVQNLRITFPSPRGPLAAVRNVSFTLGREKLGIVGESGSGKTLTGRSILRILPPRAILEADKLEFDGIDMLHATPARLQELRGARIGMVMQDPKFSLNPVMPVGRQIAEAYRMHRRAGRREADEAALAMLEQVRIRDPRRVFAAYPHELSGGMGQRAMMAMMLVPEPDLLIADEPTSALDVTVQLQILGLIDELVSRRGMGLIFISHDLPLVASFCDRVLVMYGGLVMEELAARDLERAQHPYTRGLLACLPRLDRPPGPLPSLERDPSWFVQRA
jgi:peptide/nickel transport system ATP-binding protein